MKVEYMTPTIPNILNRKNDNIILINKAMKECFVIK